MDLRWGLALLFNAVLLGVTGFALVRGGLPERVGAMVNLVASLATTVLRLIDPQFYAPAQTVVLGIDLAVAAAFYWLALKTIRFWPIWASGFALANIVASVTAPLLPRTPLLAYHSGLGIYAYLALGALFLGTWHMPRDASPALRNGFRNQQPPIDP
ncbi:hypothetical protein [Sphingomonas lycopersici]|uniref:Uncharacterized protein n=1 Tax=Sphingomonas lycopersici TaxID=2951807 RepID=A0AA42CRN5_9SPHN|nr:hypothetical protein [Sphingomonas lycopersici]MCW6536297.1 hypothetical protein [Sphingomonas lycopersici]